MILNYVIRCNWYYDEAFVNKVNKKIDFTFSPHSDLLMIFYFCNKTESAFQYTAQFKRRKH